MISTLPREYSIYWDMEAEFLYDYLFLASNLRFFEVSSINYKKYTGDQLGMVACYVNIFEIYQKSLEDLGAILLSLKRRFNIDNSCVYQKKYYCSETPILFTLMNYSISEGYIYKHIGTTRSDIERTFNLLMVNSISITLLYPSFQYSKWRDNVISNIMGFSNDQKKRDRMYNKVKHGGLVVGNGKLFKSASPNAPAVIYPNNDTANPNPLRLHSFKYDESEIIKMKSGVLNTRRLIRELVAIYLIYKYPEFVKTKGNKSAIELLEKVSKN